jgi:K(+)-stimulated pyrophosphate-energized sodium pump
VQLTATSGSVLTHILAVVFFAISFIFVYRSFYSMRIQTSEHAKEPAHADVAAD